MKVRTAFTLSDDDLRSIRAAHGRGGKATRKECLTFIDRAVRDAIQAAPTPKPARGARVTADSIAKNVEDLHARKYPTGCPSLCEACASRLGIANETEAERIARVRRTIERKFGHVGTGVARG